MRESLKVVSAALDETPTGDIILRGVLDPSSLNMIMVGDYQREVLPLSSVTELTAAMKADKSVGDIVLGMRGGDYSDRDGAIYLRNDTYVIDGLQRLSVARHLVTVGEHAGPRLGCRVYFNTTADAEKEMFKILNTRGLKLSPNVLLKNDRESSLGVQLLWDLAEDCTSPLYERVSWRQRMCRGELVTGMIILKAATWQHSAFVAPNATNREAACAALSKVVTTIGRRIAYANIKTFWEVIDKCWGVRAVTYKEDATYLRTGFLIALARTFAGHTDFWDKDRRFIMPRELMSKVKLFPVHDPAVKRMAQSNGQSLHLRDLITEHVNSGKRTRRLTPFKVSPQEGGATGKEG